jgi:hypothetical protein
MSERDAFGREKGEDSLAEMGWSWSTDKPAATPVTPPTPAAVAADPAKPAPTVSAGPNWTPPPPATVRLRRRRRRRGIIVPLVLIGIVALAIGGATTALQAGSGAIDDFQDAIRDATASVVPPAETPVGVESGSLLRAADLKSALAKLPSRQITSLRVAPERIDAQVIVKGKMHVVQVRSDGTVSDVATPVRGSVKRLRVNAAAPSRIVRTAAKRSGRAPARISYLVLVENEWQLFFDDGLHYSASANGRKVKRIG